MPKLGIEYLAAIPYTKLFNDEMDAEFRTAIQAVTAQISNLRLALADLIGLAELLAHNTDIPSEVRESILTNHRVLAAREILIATEPRDA